MLPPGALLKDWGEKKGEELFDVSVCLLFFLSFYMRSTFPGTDFDFRLKLTRQTKNNPPQERQRKTRTGGDRIKKITGEGKGMTAGEKELKGKMNTGMDTEK